MLPFLVVKRAIVAKMVEISIEDHQEVLHRSTLGLKEVIEIQRKRNLLKIKETKEASPPRKNHLNLQSRNKDPDQRIKEQLMINTYLLAKMNKSGWRDLKIEVAKRLLIIIVVKMTRSKLIKNSRKEMKREALRDQRICNHEGAKNLTEKET